LVPVAPLLLLGIWQGTELAGSVRAFAGQKRLAKVAVVVLLASIGLCNVALLGVDIRVSQSKRFASLCLAGEYAELCRAAGYVTEAGAEDSGPVAVAAYYYDAKGPRRNTFAARVLQFLTNKRVLLVPPGVGCYEPDEGLTQWAADHRVRFYLCRRRRFTVRLWHLRMPWLRSDGGSETDDWDPGYYELYEFGDGGFRRLELAMGSEALRRVPGL
jgi:hypothetical protein